MPASSGRPTPTGEPRWGFSCASEPRPHGGGVWTKSRHGDHEPIPSEERSMHPYRIDVRASAADWRRIATAAIHAREPIGQHAAGLLTAAADTGVTGTPGAGPLPDVAKRLLVFPDRAAFDSVQTWRQHAGLTWSQAIRAAAHLTPTP
ncbi:hypothetical protein EU799_03895 [Corynebacterium silvaticum]|nr:hypothetical protein [Corynebacterium silvaticum]MBH5300442.1 hypothetical protein [Corynebacterium silvaticum]TFA93285.1 hypothetical protein EU802_03765 [Corynebacterium silvaticum]TFA96698.1 hypothetical protein EU799_03895 [Corynebacterium silvaticum]TNX85046.1 hypothetical protein FIT55_03950 [Corynebacterium silvaticum]